jgi:S1-C subfamily serine protease
MRNLIRYIFLLTIIISSVYITKSVIDFAKNIITLREYQTDALIKQEKMLYPVVRVVSAQTVQASFGGGMMVASTATGFSIQYDPVDNISFIITNDHFCRDISSTSRLIVEDYDKVSLNISDDYLKAEILHSDSGLDLCLLSAHGYIKPATIADIDYDPELFENIFIVGGPTGNFPIILDTYISGESERSSIPLGNLSKSGNNFILVSEQIFPGHSGSPVFNQSGEVIGVVFAALETYGGLIISHKDIFELLFRYQNGI